jgi:SPP1 family predicted phage head-tail adaptor
MKWPAVDPGNMRSRIAILRRTAATTDISGTVEGTWETFLTTWARVEPQSGTEVVKDGQTTARLQILVTIMWQPGITPDMRVQTNNGTYLIQAIANPEELDYRLNLICLALGENE